MIIAPLEVNPGLKPDHVRQAIAGLAHEYNVVVLVPSGSAAKAWVIFTNRIVYAADVAATVDELRSGKHIGLVVFVNKFDGIDLPEDACRVLVIDGLPEAQSAEDRVESQLRRHARFGDDRQIQRIEQGMGRGVRSNEDHCVVLLLGARLSQLVVGIDSLARFSPATRAQLELSRTVAGGLQDASLEEILQVARQALNRDENWVRLAKLKLANIEPPISTVGVAAIERRRAFEAAADHNYHEAEQHMSAAIASSSDEAEQGWLLEQQASYINLTDPVRAQTTLVSARKKNRAVLRPLSGISYVRLSASADQAQRVVDYVSNNYSSPADLRLGFQAVLDDLVFDPERTEPFEEALRALAEHIGLTAERPESDLREGPDVLWALGALKYWVIEAKSGAIGNVIHKRDANQLSGSLNWFSKRYDQTTKATPVMVHRSRKLAPDASAPDGMLVLDEDGLIKLKRSVMGFAEALAAAPTNNIETVNGLLQGHRLQSGNLSGYLKNVQN
ncbi:helicase C-terminal domain-containing protein [Jatrophihabitans sp.]|uniref:helicase C-terminal domain-containing protein n=1 Tax=Jatrophihabitans sp. TaxID=1932789 RepID=UPI002C60CA0F|nr:helicase C-terminal domain-containing protein [Jatrophihabitans sp.]